MTPTTKIYKWKNHAPVLEVVMAYQNLTGKMEDTNTLFCVFRNINGKMVQTIQINDFNEKHAEIVNNEERKILLEYGFKPEN
jgi:metal-dependent HD superfamily phosphatase/phosphodiesterase